MAAAVDPFSDPTPAPVEKTSRKDILAAVRDVVTVKTDRLKVPRSQTNQGSPSGTSPSTRRAVSDESITKSAERKSKSKKAGGAHTDVIDKLDFTGIGVATLHHDGPFDACAPSRNVQKHKAPMAAWSPRDEELGVPSVPPPNDSRISPRAQATMAAMAQMSSGFDSGPYPSASLGDSGPYPRMPAAGRGGGFDEWGTAPPKKRHDALAEAWGMHEPEPFEEFMAGGGEHSRPGSIRNGVDSKKGRDTYVEERPARRREPRTKLPPPAPIALPGQVTYDEEGLAASASYYASSAPDDNAPKRSKSLLNRIKKMKANPNIPLSATDEGTDASPARADFGQALGKTTSRGEALPSPGLPVLGPNGSTTPGSDKKDDEYFERPANATGVGAMPQSPGSSGLGRKPSLMQKIRGATRGNKQQQQQP